MLELIVYPKSINAKLGNNSPFCSKSEIFLKLTKIPFTVTEFNDNPSKFPKSKLPVLKHDGTVISDSYFIQQYLEKTFDVALDADLSEEDKARGYMITKTLEEFLYWSLLSERWFVDSNWEKLRDSYFNSIPKLVRGFVTGVIRKKQKKAAMGHGMARHTPEEILALGKEGITHLAVSLGDRPYILGDQPSSFDSSSYAFVSSLLHSEFGPELQKFILQKKNLVDYDKRMFELLSEKVSQ